MEGFIVLACVPPALLVYLWGRTVVLMVMSVRGVV
jgi:hypothetical protein